VSCLPVDCDFFVHNAVEMGVKIEKLIATDWQLKTRALNINR